MGALKKIYDQGKVMLLGDEQEKYETLAQDMVDRDERFNRYDDMDKSRWGGQGSVSSSSAHYPPITTMCSTSMEPGGFVSYREPSPLLPTLTEWRCEGCGSVMLSEHRACEECGSPRHFLYSVADD